MTEGSITLTVSFRGQPLVVTLPADATLEDLSGELESLTTVHPSLQKLLYKGKKTFSPSTALDEAGLKDGMKAQLLGRTPSEMGEMQKTEAETKRRDDIMAKRAAKAASKVRSTGVAKMNSYIFHSIVPLPHLPSPHLAQAILQKLSDDPAILHVMAQHKFSIGVLTELAPHEHPGLLGLNQNAGEVIKLRVRTDAYDGMRNYNEVRRVLCHELTHCVWGDHDNNFKELNSRLNREVAAFESSQAAGTHSLSAYDGPAYERSVEAEALAHRLDSGTTLTTSQDGSGDDTPEARRSRALEAALRRQAKAEQEIEDMCGSAGASKDPSA